MNLPKPMFLLVVFGLLIATPLVVEAQDQVGIYFDEEATSTSATTTEPYSQVQAWVLLTSSSATEPISGFEFQVQVHTEGPDPILLWNLPPQSVNLLDAPQFNVWLGQTVIPGPVVELAQVTVIVPEAGQTVWFTLHALENPALTEPPQGGAAVYLPSYFYGDPPVYIAMNSALGCFGKPVAGINREGNPPQHAWSDPPEYIGVFGADAPLPTFSLHNLGDVIVEGELSLSGDSPVSVQMGDGFFTDEGLQFQILPGQEVEFHFNVPSFGAIDKTVHLEICDWQSDSFFTRNGGEPSSRWDPAEVDFGPITIGLDSPEQLVTFTNTGQDLLYPYDSFSVGDFRLEVAYGSDNPLYPNQSFQYHTVFSPSTAGPITEIVEWYYSENLLTLTGRGMDSNPQCDIQPLALDCGEVPVAEPPFHVRYISVTNEGGGVLEGEFVFDDPAGGFMVDYDPGAFALTHGETVSFRIRFEPPTPGYYEATLSAGPHCQEVTISGTGVDMGPTCEWDFDYLVGDVAELPIQAVGDGNSYSMIYRNRGGDILNVDISLEDPTGTFTMYSNEGPHSLYPNTGLYIQFYYEPVAAGRDTAILHTDSICGDIMLVGHGVEPWPDCWASHHEFVDIGRVRVGDTGSTTIQIRNTGYTILNGYWETEGDQFSLNLAGPFILEPGESTLRTLYFSPQDGGTSIGFVSTGLDSCPGLDCQGLGIPQESDRLGLYWNEEASITELQTDQDGQVVPLYLVLNAPYDTGPISDWSMSFSIEGPSEIQNGWVFPTSGQHNYMAGNRHDFHFESPRFLYDGMVLAEIPVLVPTPGEMSTLGLYAGSFNLDGEAEWFELVLEEDITVNSDLSAVGNDTETPTPSRTALKPCYPNPFNPEIHIPFELARLGPVNVTIYDLAGRLVKELTRDSFDPGRYELLWNGRDSQGRNVPSNIYYVRFIADGGVQMRKITMVK